VSTLKARVSGAWVATAAVGKVRLGGVDIPFGGAPAPAYEALSWPAAPTFTDLSDGTSTYNMGVQFSLVSGKNCVGVRWRVPDTVATPIGGPHSIALWRVSDLALLASKTFVPAPGGYQDVLFDAPAACSTGLEYVASIYTNHYVFRAAGGNWPVTSPSGNVVADIGKLIADQPPNTYPSSSQNSYYYISPLIAL